MEERPADMAAPRTSFGNWIAIGVGHAGERGVGLFENGRVMKFVTAKDRAGIVAWKGRVENRAPVAQVERPLLKGRHDAKKPGHPMRGAGFVDQRFTKSHVATAFAVDRTRLCVRA